MIDFDSQLIKEYHPPCEPKLFPLFVNNREVKYGFEEDE